jgi:hypothetical protein
MTSRDTSAKTAKAVPTRLPPAAMTVARSVAKHPAPRPSAAGGTAAALFPSPRKRTATPSRRSAASSRRNDPARLAELKSKLGDEDYMNGAILRIATVLSARLTLR